MSSVANSVAQRDVTIMVGSSSFQLISRFYICLLSPFSGSKTGPMLDHLLSFLFQG